MPKKRPVKSAAKRAWKSMPQATRSAIKKSSGGKFTNAQKKAVGKSVRKQRLARGANPNTGGRVTSGQLGLKGSAKKAYKKSSSSTKQAVVSGMGKSGLKSTGRKYNKLANTANTRASSGPTRKTKTVSRIAKNRGISRAAANRVRKSRKK